MEPAHSNVALTIVVPTYDEPDLGGWLDALRAHAPDAEILLVDDSHAEARETLRRTAAARGGRILEGPGRGKGAAIREAFLAARGDVIVMIDADSDAATLQRIPEFVAKAREGFDVVIAERMGHHDALHRVFLSAAFRWVQRLFIFHSMRFRDTQCGFKVFRREAARQLAEAQTMVNGLFDVEYLYIAVRRGMRIAQLPLPMWPESRPSHFRLVPFFRKEPIELLRMKINGMRGRYSR